MHSAMARAITWDELRDLAAFEAVKGCAISLYLDLDPAASQGDDLRARLNSLLDEAARADGANRRELSHDQRLRLREDLERIRGHIVQELDRDGAHGLAVFCAGLDNVWRSLPLTEPVRDAVKVDRHLFLAPLVPLVGRGEGALVLVVGREKGQLYQLRAGRLDELADRFEEQPRRHDRGGLAQARQQRHVDELAREHLKTVAGELDRALRRLHGTKAVVVCSEETWAEFQGLVSAATRAAIVGWTSADAHASPAELLTVATPVLDRWRDDEEVKLLDRWQEEAGRNGRAVGGWAATLEATSDGRVELLLAREGVDRPAWRCAACGRVAASGGKCPLDGTELDEHSEGLDLAVHRTLSHGGTVWAVRTRPDLDAVGGIAALLRF